jgi:hypothetical protein
MVVEPVHSVARAMWPPTYRSFFPRETLQVDLYALSLLEPPPIMMISMENFALDFRVAPFELSMVLAVKQ